MTDINPHLAKFMSSQQTESSETQERVFNSGKALVKELKLETGVDTLAKWMAHYVAEQIVTAENTKGPEKAKAEQRCFETILKLWQHRASFPNGRRPLENFEPIMNVLDRLDPDNARPFYLVLSDDELSKEIEQGKTNEVYKWLNIALEIDSAARSLISYAVEQAAQHATDEETAAWLESGIKLMDDKDLEIIIRLLEPDEDQDETAQEQLRREQERSLVSKRDKLDAFTGISKRIRTAINDEIEDLKKRKL